MMTASHMPMHNNGLKFFTRDGGLDKRDITAILEMATQECIQARWILLVAAATVAVSRLLCVVGWEIECTQSALQPSCQRQHRSAYRVRGSRFAVWF